MSTKDINTKQIVQTLLDSLEAEKNQSGQIETIKKFVSFLAKNNMLSQSGKMLEILQEEMIRRSGQTKVKFENAGDLKDEDISKIRESVSSLLGATQLEKETDKNLLGGIKMKIADKVIDATIRRKLDDLYKQMNN